MNINKENALKIGKRVFLTEIDALEQVKSNLGENFIKILLELDQCEGKVIITGMGKSGHIARKIAATMSSLGISSFFLHPAEAMHGDLGMVQENDIVIAISYSGESEEITRIIPNIKIIGAKLIGLTCNSNSTLANKSDITEIFSNIKEACHLGLAPTTSTTVVLAYGDALAITLSELRNFSKKDFGLFHPAGSLGKKLTTRVTDLMVSIEKNDCVENDVMLEKAILQIEKIGCNLLPVLNKEGKLFGTISNKEIENALFEKVNIYKTPINNWINKIPIYVEEDTMAISALQIMVQNEILSVPVVQDGYVIGILSRKKILEMGIYI